MKYFRLIWFWIKNLFVTQRPILSHLEYANFLVETKSYFIFSWKMENAYRLRIKTTRFKSILNAGSAYIAIPEDSDQVEIVIYGSWRSRKYVIKLERMVIDRQIDFPVLALNSLKVKLVIPVLEPKFSDFKVNPFKAHIVNKTQLININNISFPN